MLMYATCFRLMCFQRLSFEVCLQNCDGIGKSPKTLKICFDLLAISINLLKHTNKIQYHIFYITMNNFVYSSEFQVGLKGLVPLKPAKVSLTKSPQRITSFCFEIYSKHFQFSHNLEQQQIDRKIKQYIRNRLEHTMKLATKTLINCRWRCLQAKQLQQKSTEKILLYSLAKVKL